MHNLIIKIYKNRSLFLKLWILILRRRENQRITIFGEEVMKISDTDREKTGGTCSTHGQI